MDEGDTFRRSIGDHLWVVVSDPQLDQNRVLIVNLTTVRRDHDPACVLNAGDHSFVKHASYMRYSGSQIVSARDLDQKLSAGQIILEGKVSAQVLQRIRTGAAASEFIPIENLRLLQEQGSVPNDPDTTSK